MIGNGTDGRKGFIDLVLPFRDTSSIAGQSKVVTEQINGKDNVGSDKSRRSHFGADANIMNIT